MLDLCGRPVLWHIIENTKRVTKLDQVCLATSTLPLDDPLASIARECEIECVRGDPEKVLDRVYQAAVHCRADLIVDIGGDCPFIYPRLLDDAISFFLKSDCEYLCNYEPPTFPEGFDINILTVEALATAYRLAIAPSQRVHPFSYLTRHRTKFRIQNYTMLPDLSEYHWSLDFPEDVAFIRAVYEKLYRPGWPIELEQIISLVEAEAEIGKVHRTLLRPRTLHAFWNSPGMMKDMNDDIVALVGMAQTASGKRDFTLACRCYDEIVLIAAELRRYADYEGTAR